MTQNNCDQAIQKNNIMFTALNVYFLAKHEINKIQSQYLKEIEIITKCAFAKTNFNTTEGMYNCKSANVTFMCVDNNERINMTE